MSQEKISVLIITGSVGVGKTTTAFALSNLLNDYQYAHALVDVDAIRTAYPAPENDRFNAQLGFRNLAAVCANYIEAGARFLILVDVVETRATISLYERAIPSSSIQVVRLLAELSTIDQRLQKRETEDSLDWFLNRARELTTIMDENQVADILINTEDKSPQEVAKEILDCLALDI